MIKDVIKWKYIILIITNSWSESHFTRNCNHFSLQILQKLKNKHQRKLDQTLPILHQIVWFFLLPSPFIFFFNCFGKATSKSSQILTVQVMLNHGIWRFLALGANSSQAKHYIHLPYHQAWTVLRNCAPRTRESSLPSIQGEFSNLMVL